MASTVEGVTVVEEEAVDEETGSSTVLSGVGRLRSISGDKCREGVVWTRAFFACGVVRSGAASRLEEPSFT